MRSFLTVICAVLLLLVVASALAAEPIDDDVRAARAAERTESIRLEQKLDAPAQQVDVTVTEKPVDAETQSDAKADDKADVTASETTKTHHDETAARTTRSTSGSKQSDESDAPQVSDEPQTKTPVAVTPSHPGRPDKVALMMQETQTGRTANKQSGSLGTILLTILKLAIVLILAYLTILALKWFSSRHDVMPSNNRQFKMVDTLRFNNTSSMHLVEIKGTTLLVGCTSGQVNVLKEFDEDETPAVDIESSGKFAEYLAKYSDMSGKHGPSGRIAGLLRDCSGYLRNRYQGARTGAHDEK